MSVKSKGIKASRTKMSEFDNLRKKMYGTRARAQSESLMTKRRDRLRELMRQMNPSITVL